MAVKRVASAAERDMLIVCDDNGGCQELSSTIDPIYCYVHITWRRRLNGRMIDETRRSAWKFLEVVDLSRLGQSERSEV